MKHIFICLLLLTIAANAAPKPCELEFIAPTPSGTGHLGMLESGACVTMRIALPKVSRLGNLTVQLGTVVGFSGKGFSYQLLIHKPDSFGNCIYTGPVESNGDRWNALNHHPIDLSNAVDFSDLKQGWLDIVVTAKVSGDCWTVYGLKSRQPKATATILDAHPPLDAPGMLPLGEWTEKTVKTTPVKLLFPLGDKVEPDQDFRVIWKYRRGAHGLAIHSVRLLIDGKPVAEDKHRGWAGAGSNKNTYTLHRPPDKKEKKEKKAKLEIEATVSSSGGTNSFGQVFLLP